jgi:amino acid adenylation domain-containing protein
MNSTAALEELKKRAKAGDREALQELRRVGYFSKRKAARDGYPISAAQRRLWILDQMLTDRSVYNMPVALLFEGPLDTDAFSKALEAIVDRHESLRTTFGMIDGELRQFVRDESGFRLDQIDFSRECEAETEARNLALRHAAQPFDLRTGPMLRATLIRLAPLRHLFLFSTHHIINDAWSANIMVRELAALYNAWARGLLNPLSPLRLHYKDYAVWQSQQLAGDAGRIHREFWLEKFSGGASVLPLPVDYPRSAVRTFAGKHVFDTFDSSLTAQLARVGRGQGATLFVTLTALVKVLLYRYTGCKDITVGTAVAGRDHPDLENQIGFYVNTLPIRDILEATDTFRDVISKVRQTCTEAYEHQMYPFDQLVSDLRLQRNLRHSPLFDVSVQLQHREEESFAFENITVSEYDTGFGVSKVDLEFDFVELDGELHFTIGFDAGLFTPESMSRTKDHLRQLALGAVNYSDLSIARLPLLTASERDQVLRDFNVVPTDDRHNNMIVGLFEDLVARNPAQIAVTFEREQLSYTEVNQRANQLAHWLRNHGARPEVTIGVFMERSTEALIALLAILKAGAIYVPLDHHLPLERLRMILEDCRAPVVLSQEDLRDKLPDFGGLVFCVDSRRCEIEKESDENLARLGSPDSAAYLIYTSGSTGTPKGALVGNRGFVNMILDSIHGIGVTSNDRCLAFASCSFDASIYETFLALLAGGCLVLVRSAILTDTDAFEAYLQEQQVTVATLIPSWLTNLTHAEMPTLRTVISAGEAPSVADAKRYARGAQFINAYGPTEASVCSAWFRVQADDDYPSGVPIGLPIANTKIFILDSNLEPLPIGVPGEICIAGVGLARGYLDRPDLTAERFVPDPFSAALGARMYRTGDLARYTPDGLIELIGRVDSQVKLRGYRIELGEIETALETHPKLRQAVVVVRDDGGNDKKLVAYFVSAEGTALHTRELRMYLESKLPEYMVPTVFVRLKRLPLNVAGKVDRKALPAPHWDRSELPSAFVAPRNDLERILAKIFADILGVDKVGIDDGFFDLGGNSLLAIRLISRLRDLLQAEISIVRFFESPTIAELARALSGAEANKVRLEKIARALDRLESLSDEEKRLMLEKKRNQTTSSS